MVDGWYYDNAFYLFMCIGPYMDKIFTVWGAYYILVQNKTRRAYLFVFPLGLAVAKIVWLLFVTSHEEFHQIPPITYYAYGVGLAFFLIFISDYLAWRKYHRADAHERRLENIAQAHVLKLLPAEKIADDFVLTLNERNLKAY